MLMNGDASEWLFASLFLLGKLPPFWGWHTSCTIGSAMIDESIKLVTRGEDEFPKPRYIILLPPKLDLPEKVVEIMKRQPLNPFTKLEITILPRVCQETK